MAINKFKIRNAQESEFDSIGKLMVQVYSGLDGFPKESDQPEYYSLLANIGQLTKKPHTKIFVAVNNLGKLGGAVVYFDDMKYYGSGGTATLEKKSSGFRLLAVDPHLRGHGIGKKLTNYCINKAKESTNHQLIIHTTESMQIAWKMYEKLGFIRSKDLDFLQDSLPVFGFRLKFDKER